MPERRSVVLVTVDSLRADRTAVGGCDTTLMPTLDRLAADGLTFTNAIAPGPATGGSIPVTVTGEYPLREDPEGPSQVDTVRRHVAVHDTLAEQFSRLGYQTAGFSTNPWISQHYDYDRGFDYFEDFLQSGDDDETPDLRGESMSERLHGHLQDWWSNSDVFLPWEAFYDDVVDWIRTADQPYFLWVFLIDVHMPYHPPEEYRSRSSVTRIPAHLWLLSGAKPTGGPLFKPLLVGAYDDTVRYTDEFLSRLVEDLGSDPLLVVHADHGEEFGEHGAYGHGANLCEEVINVPLVVANGPEGRIDRPVSLGSMPTLLQELARGELPSVDRPYVYTGNSTNLAVRGESWKYVRHADGEEFYRVEDGNETPITNEALREIGEDLVADWHENQAERERVRSAVGQVCQQYRV